MENKYIIFDLDDTLVLEIDFLKSAYKYIASQLGNENLYEIMINKYKQKVNVFEYLSNVYNVDLKVFLEQYRNHIPNINLIEGASEVLDFCKNKNYKIGLISDGRSVSQRNKLKALKIEKLFEEIIISEEFGSEKPNENNYLTFMKYDDYEYVYIADNTNKDFVTPNKLGWKTICLKDCGNNIHSQNFSLPPSYLPQITINNLSELLTIL